MGRFRRRHFARVGNPENHDAGHWDRIRVHALQKSAAAASIGEMRFLSARAAAASALFSAGVVVPFLPREHAARAWCAGAVAVFAVLAGLLVCAGRFPGFLARLGAARRALAARPARALALAAALSVAASSFPVAFLGRSYVSPNFGTPLLYERFPTLPGGGGTALSDPMGSDIGAMAWQSIPYSAVEHQALLADRSLPIWNRFNSAGTPLLAQGQSMFGDPLHLLVVAAGGASWAWDLKFLAAKVLFALSLGLVVRRVAGHLPSALLVTIAAPFMGFFIYRINHPAVFAFCYAPWVLYAWLRLSDAGGPRAIFGSAAGLLLANFALMNSGAAKEAAALLATMNLCGVAVLLASPGAPAGRFLRLAVAAGAGVMLVLISAPIWAGFLETLRQAYTTAAGERAFQIQPSLLIGAFDEAFYRPFVAGGRVFNPSLNFLLLGGVLYYAATAGEQILNRRGAAIAAVSLVPFSLAFGLIPPDWIARLPLLGSIAHIDDTFGSALLILWAVVAGLGFSAAARRLATGNARGDLLIAAMLLLGLVAGWGGYAHAVQRWTYGSGTLLGGPGLSQSIPVSPYLWAYLGVLAASLAGLAWTVRRSAASGHVTVEAALIGALCVWALIGRGAQAGQVSLFSDFLVCPPARADFLAKSPAVEESRRASFEIPGRTVGIDTVLFPGWNAFCGLEGLSGPDALMNRRYRNLMDAFQTDRRMDWMLCFRPGYVAAERKVLDFLNVRFFLGDSAMPALSASGLRLRSAGDLALYESSSAWPRAFFVDSAARYRDVGQFAKLVRGGDGRPFAAISTDDPDDAPLFSGPSALAGAPAPAASRIVVPAERYALNSNSTAFSVRSPGPGVAVLTEAYWPGYPHALLRRPPGCRLPDQPRLHRDSRSRCRTPPDRGLLPAEAVHAAGMAVRGCSSSPCRRGPGRLSPPPKALLTRPSESSANRWTIAAPAMRARPSGRAASAHPDRPFFGEGLRLT